MVGISVLAPEADSMCRGLAGEVTGDGKVLEGDCMFIERREPDSSVC